MANQFSINVDQSNDGIKVVSVPKTWLEGGNTPNWITPVVNYGMTSGGILIPQRVDSEGRPEITQSGSIVAVKKYNNVSIPANSIVDIFEIDSSSHTIFFPYTALRLGYIWADEPTKWQIEIIHRLDGGYNGYTEIIKQDDQRILKSNFSERQMIIEKKILACYMSSDRLRLRFRNSDDSEKKISSLYVMGVI